MSPETGPLFVERRAYRRRRLIDAARLLPILGVTLMCLPLLWTGSPDTPTSTTYAMIYFFCLWLALVVGAAVLSRHLRSETESADTGAEDAPDGADGPLGGA